jgi:hypothetical protein
MMHWDAPFRKGREGFAEGFAPVSRRSRVVSPVGSSLRLEVSGQSVIVRLEFGGGGTSSWKSGYQNSPVTPPGKRQESEGEE